MINVVLLKWGHYCGKWYQLSNKILRWTTHNRIFEPSRVVTLFLIQSFLNIFFYYFYIITIENVYALWFIKASDIEMTHQKSVSCITKWVLNTHPLHPCFRINYFLKMKGININSSATRLGVTKYVVLLFNLSK